VDDDSTISIPYDAEKQSESFDWSVTADNENAGTVTSVTIGDGIELAIYTPYGYDAEDTETNYPVLYLIPGMQTEYNTWFTGGKADKVFDNLIAEGKVAPTILVTMTRDTAKMDYNDVWDSADERSKSNGDGDGYINYEDGSESGSGTENMIKSLVVTDVIPYIDENYHTAADSAHRAIIGTSMGGVATTQIWMTSNELFDYYGFFSGADMWFKTDDDAKAADEYKALKPVYEADYTSLLDAAAASSEGKKFLVGGGITDRNAFGGDQNSAGADNVSDWMTENQVEHEYSIVGGGHDWTTWTQLLMKFTEFLSADDSGWGM
jgi:enterochelin esterase-like enzyme